MSTVTAIKTSRTLSAPKAGKPKADKPKAKEFGLTAAEGKNIAAALANAEKASKALRDTINKYALRAKRAGIKRADAGRALATGLGFDKMGDAPKSLQNAWQYVAAQAGLVSRESGNTDKAETKAETKAKTNSTKGEAAANATKTEPPAIAISLADAVSSGPESLAAKLASLLLDHQIKALIDALQDTLDA